MDRPQAVMDAKQQQRIINCIRFLAVDAIEKAKSGHPGMPMGAAPMAFTLFDRFLRHCPQRPEWPDRDRFVLSAGHGSMLLYALLHLSGYDLPLEELKNFRQWNSRTPGHPEYGHTPGVETTTGPLGQGLANAVGMAIAERHLAARFNKPGFDLVDHFTYAMVGDGCLMEGISHEAASLAGHLGLGRLIVLYDDNHISIDGPTEITFTEDVVARFQAYGWHTQRVADGNDCEAIAGAIETARQVTDKPSLIAVRTHIAFGAPTKQDSSEAHGSPLGAEEVRGAKQRLDWPVEPTFHIPPEAEEFRRSAMERSERLHQDWADLWQRYKKEFPAEAEAYIAALERKFGSGWKESLPSFEKPMATRAASGQVINALAGVIPELMGGSADLTPSNNTLIKSSYDFTGDSPIGRYLRFGVREHAMGAIANGLALHTGIIPYCGTFLVFADYMRPAIRLAALMKLPVIYIFTHDSIGVGEDGPTHQPVEQVASLRAIPGLTVFRPADPNETAAAWEFALRNGGGPTALALTRQAVPVLDLPVEAVRDGVRRGAYIVYRSSSDGKHDLIIVATGSEVSPAIAAAHSLEAEGKVIRVVSMPSWELFASQPEEYRRMILPSGEKTISVEAQVTMGWERWTGSADRCLGINRFGASAPGDVLFKEFGFTPEAIAGFARRVLSQ
ncbi:MAG: transketolase [candidate division Zixibacteria bacterium]|nr:transketolase [candidate division Zixibacteria bacterium]